MMNKESIVGSTGMKVNTSEKNEASMPQRFSGWLRNEKDAIKNAARNFGEGVGGGALVLLVMDHFAKYTPSETVYTDPYTGPFSVTPGKTFNLAGQNFYVVSETNKSMVMRQVLSNGTLGNPITVTSGNPYTSSSPYTVLAMHNNVVASVHSFPYGDIGHVFNGIGTNSYMFLWGSSNSNGTFSLYVEGVQYRLAMVPNWVAQFLSPEHIAMTLLITGAIGTALGVGAKLLRKRAAKD